MKILRDNGLTIVLLLASLGTVVGMLFTGLHVYNDELAEHRGQMVTLPAYLISGHFLSALFENWESEFLQMSAYVVLTAFLFQRGSAESKDPDEPSSQNSNPADDQDNAEAPLPVRMGGMASSLYSYSLGWTLFLLFVLSFLMHVRESASAQAVEAMLHGQQAPSIGEQFFSARLWFESLQNWQSEFLSTAVLVVLSIFLRFRGSPESKTVSDPHSKTGA